MEPVGATHAHKSRLVSLLGRARHVRTAHAHDQTRYSQIPHCGMLLINCGRLRCYPARTGNVGRCHPREVAACTSPCQLLLRTVACSDCTKCVASLSEYPGRLATHVVLVARDGGVLRSSPLSIDSLSGQLLSAVNWVALQTVYIDMLTPSVTASRRRFVNAVCSEHLPITLYTTSRSYAASAACRHHTGRTTHKSTRA